MLETIKNWVDKASVRIKVHNDELEPIQREVPMTVQQMIEDKDKAIAELQAQLTEKNKANKEHVDAVSKL
jgi:hypothetical protein